MAPNRPWTPKFAPGPSGRGRTQSSRGEKLKNADERDRQIAALRERLSKLSEASLRITEDLDLDIVLQGVVDAARSLTGATRGCIVVVDDSGQLQAFLTSGVTEEEHRLIVALPGGIEFFHYVTRMPEPLRLADFSAYTTALGLPEVSPPLGPVGSFLGVPIRHRGRHVGNVNVTDKEGGGEFTQDDEETLAMFGSQAAMAIANARRHQEEQRARTDLETLINTSPVGVVVFNAVTGVPVSLNREGRRLVDGLTNPGQTAEQLLDVLTIRRADGREISLREFPLAEALSTGETVRAEEIVISVPDGRSVSVLLNATAIRSEEGQVESLVVTLQDMTALEELDRLRAEFLGMVSHELRAPLTSIRGSADALLDAADNLDPAEMHQFHRIIREQADHMQGLITDLLDVARIEAGALSVSPEPTEAAVLVDRARNTFLSGGGRNNLDIDLPRDLPRVMADRRRIVQVLGNLLSNAARHSRESSAIRVTAAQKGVHVEFSVADDGVGISAERLPHLFRKFSRLEGEERGREIGGSGLGLAICKGIVEAHGGRTWAESAGPGLGARFTFALPGVEEAGFVQAESAQPSSRSGRSGRNRIRVLTVDDDPQTLRYVRDALTEAGYAPIVTGDPDAVGRLMVEEKPHLVLLDLMLPGSDGIEMMESVPELSDVPVIFLSAYGRDQIVARALESGAEDYIVKPFSPTELVARIQTVMRRRTATESAEPSEPYVLGELTVNYTERRVFLAGRPIQLTDIEYRLLFELSVNAGRVLSLSQLLQRVWGPGHSGSFALVRTVVKNLRSKLGDDADHPTYIFTEPRVGYRMPKGERLGQEEANGIDGGEQTPVGTRPHRTAP